ncbi:MAG: cupin domain-containing protein [Verrucomicrobia bacterium]|nr:cupin domain-containing protein [Verrucomicrobiota bacterium]
MHGPEPFYSPVDTSISQRRFVGAAEKITYRSAFALEEWLCRSDVVSNDHLLIVRATMAAGHSHPFHNHPTREEVIYVLSGRAEQWVGRQKRELSAGDVAFIPMGEVHGTYNPYAEPLVFLAILSPANAPEPSMVDVSSQEPWCSLREASKP